MKKDWKNSYPLDTFEGETKEELENFVEARIKEAYLEIKNIFEKSGIVCEDDIYQVDYDERSLIYEIMSKLSKELKIT